MDYTHDYTFTYNLPFNKIPILSFLTGNVKYAGTYNWQRAPLGQEEYGSIIQNSRTINGQLQANFMTLYNKVPLLKRINSTSNSNAGRAKVTDSKVGTDGGKEGDTKTPEKPRAELKPPKPVEEMTPKEKRKWEREKRKFDREQKRKEKEKEKVNPVVGFAGRLLMTVRTISGTYAQTDGTLLPGYNQPSRLLGFNPSFNGNYGGFLFGQQSYSVFGRETGYHIGEVAAANDWLVKNPAINRQHTITHTQTITGRGTLEPIKDLTIDLSLNRNETQNTNDFYRFNDLTQQFESQSLYRTSSLTYSTISIGTAFEKLGKGYKSANFDRMLDRSKEVSQYFGARNSNSVGTVGGYASGYGQTQQDVLIGAFLSSYTSSSVSQRSVNPFASLPLPNWTVNYNGLTKFPFMKDRVKNFVVRHGYSSTVSMAGVQSNLNSTVDGNGNYNARDLNDNFIAGNNVQAVTITERFSPLIGIDATWNIKKQGLITKFEIKKDRSATLSLNNNQVTEVLGNEIVIGTGYKFEKVRFPFKIKQARPENPLNIRFDFTFRDNLTVIRKVVEGTTQATAGQRVISIKSSVDYNVTNNLILQFYYDQVITTPKIQTSYPTGNLSTGIRLRFNLGGI
jgi:cell surface protein SprA